MDKTLKELNEKLEKLGAYEKKLDQISQSLKVLEDNLIHFRHLSKNAVISRRNHELRKEEELPLEIVSMKEYMGSSKEEVGVDTVPPMTSEPSTGFDRWRWLSEEALARALFIESLLGLFVPLSFAAYYAVIFPPQLIFVIVISLMTIYAYVAKRWHDRLIYFSTHIIFIFVGVIISSSSAGFSLFWRLGVSPYSFYIAPIVLFIFTAASSIYSGRSLKEPLLPVIAIIHGVLLGFLTSVHMSQYWIEFVDLTPTLIVFILYSLSSFLLILQRQEGNVLSDLSPLTFTVVFWGVQQTLSKAIDPAILPILNLSFLCQVILLGATSFSVKRSNFTLFAMISSVFLILNNEYYSQFAPFVVFAALLIHIAVFAASIPNLKQTYFFPLLNSILALPSFLYLRGFFATYPYTLLFFLGILICQSVLTLFYLRGRERNWPGRFLAVSASLRLWLVRWLARARRWLSQFRSTTHTFVIKHQEILARALYIGSLLGFFVSLSFAAYYIINTVIFPPHFIAILIMAIYVFIAILLMIIYLLRVQKSRL